ncbi:dicentracin-like [Kryptolebias marmoratus]|uniref:dicentracin-like n=1 Tax=Kryptolebias marmoratus TaxID=37003 RepID=UPI0007F8A0AB|nr:dicentracin-like [Kryptolebias marmoratus]
MKCTVVFLVLSMVVLMAQPSEGFFGLLFHGIKAAVHGITHLVRRRGRGKFAENQLDQQQLDNQQREQEQLDQELEQLDQNLEQLAQDQQDQQDQQQRAQEQLDKQQDQK